MPALIAYLLVQLINPSVILSAISSRIPGNETQRRKMS
jgi:hypothetical protein